MKFPAYLLNGFLLLSSLLFVSNVAFADVNATPNGQGIKLVWSHATEGELFKAVAESNHASVVFDPTFVDTSGPDGVIAEEDPVTLLKSMLAHTTYDLSGDDQNPVIHITSVQDWPMDAVAPQSEVTNDTKNNSNNSFSVQSGEVAPPTINQLPKYGSQPATYAGNQIQQVQTQRGNQYNYILYSYICRCSP